MDDPFIQIFPNSLSIDFCNEIIELHKIEPNKGPGTTIKGVFKNVKNTTDYRINQYPDKNDCWYEINKKLVYELSKQLQNYVNILNINIFNSIKGTNSGYKIVDLNMLTDDGFLVQKYEKGVGKYVYHNDAFISYNRNRSRLITYLWYLNDIEEGGETEFLGGKFKIKPETGKLILFPASWIYPHQGCIPISSDKYIITGWLYEEL